MKLRILALAAAVIAALCADAKADIAATKTILQAGCVQYAMCVAQASTGPCLATNGVDTLVASGVGFYTYSFYSTKGVGAYSCDIYSDDGAYTATSTAKGKINSTSLTTAAPIVSVSGLLSTIWIECSAVGTQATVNMIACPLAR